ncbi:MAG: succinate dehydrogenase assembly factor 2 [Rickettsiales bacterium]|nr:succinate dehydrogenase assembly factor 2 [Rickettsiales bacterium]
MINEITALRRKIIYRSHKRGFLESELIFRKFITQSLIKLRKQELKLLDLLLSYDDTQIIHWIHKKEIPPKNLESLIETINNNIKS